MSEELNTSIEDSERLIREAGIPQMEPEQRHFVLCRVLGSIGDERLRISAKMDPTELRVLFDSSLADRKGPASSDGLFRRHYGYALGPEDYDDTVWTALGQMNRVQLPVAVTFIEDREHRRDFAEMVREWFPYMDPGQTIGEALTEQDPMGDGDDPV